MSNFPHSTISSSLSTSPLAFQTSLETLIANSRNHPLPRRFSHGGGEEGGGETDPHDTSPSRRKSHGNIEGHQPTSRRPSEYQKVPKISTIQEASYDEGALLFDDDEETTERSALIGRSGGRSSRRSSRRKSYGAVTEPIGRVSTRAKRAPSPDAPSGNSRSRSTARTPPRADRSHVDRMQNINGESVEDTPGLLLSTDDEDTRGRTTIERPLSRSSSPITTKSASLYSVGGGDRRRRRQSNVTARFADDSSGDEGGDVARGLAATGGGAFFGGRGGLGMTPASAATTIPGEPILEEDPVDVLGPEDLELPLNEEGLEVRQWPEAIRNETAIILRSAVPAFFTQIAEWSLVLASVVSIGHLSTTDLAASSLASMTASVSSFSILQGLGTALDTLLPAAWTSSDPSRVGLWAQRTAVVMLGSTIPMFVLWWNVEGVLLALGQEPEVAARAGLYLRWLSFGIPGYGGNVIVKKYLQAQGLMKIPTIVLFFIAPLNLVLNYLLVWGPDWIRLGFRGGALATAISYNLTFLISLGWAVFFGPKEAFHPVTFKHLFSKLGTVTSLGLAGTIMVSSEWWAWEACALAASQLGPTTLAAQSVLLSTASTFFQVPASLGIAASVRCGNLLGAGRAWEAKWASRAAMFVSIIFSCINSAICLIFRKNWGYLFNNDEEVVAIVAQVMVWIALFQITDGIGAMASSILRALGRHTTGAFINLTAYYVIGLPFGIWLTFTPSYHLGLVGLWIGLSIALGYASIVSFILVWRADWHRAVERVRERLGFAAHGEVGEDGKWHGDEGESEALLGDDERD